MIASEEIYLPMLFGEFCETYSYFWNRKTEDKFIVNGAGVISSEFWNQIFRDVIGSRIIEQNSNEMLPNTAFKYINFKQEGEITFY